jgi:ankyrin repeat protein
MTALCYACSNGFYEIAEELVSKKADVNRQQKSGMTPLMLAANYGHDRIVSLLLKKGVDMTTKASGGRAFGKTALDLSKENNHTKVSGCIEGFRKHGEGEGASS